MVKNKETVTKGEMVKNENEDGNAKANVNGIDNGDRNVESKQ